MRKNKFFIAGLVTVFVALVSLTLVSSTWAKYTSNVKGSDEARVAYWGFGTGETVELNLFATSYDAGEADLTVESGSEVIAPGTSNSAVLKLTYAGAQNPEVDYQLSFALGTCEMPTDLANHPNIKWAAHKDGEAATWVSWAGLATQLEGLTIKGEAGAAVPSDLIVIEWKWAFGDGSTDVADTALGNAALSTNLKVEIVITATQLGDD